MIFNYLFNRSSRFFVMIICLLNTNIGQCTKRNKPKECKTNSEIFLAGIEGIKQITSIVIKLATVYIMMSNNSIPFDLDFRLHASWYLGINSRVK